MLRAKGAIASPSSVSVTECVSRMKSLWPTVFSSFRTCSLTSAGRDRDGGSPPRSWSDEWQYYISGTARIGVFHGEGRNNTVEFHPSDVGYVPQSIGHYVQNIGKDTLRFLEVFTSPEYSDISLASWMNNVPHELVSAHLNIDVETLRKMAQSKTSVVPV